MLDPTKTIGKLKEQVHKEYIARRNFPINWPKYANPKVKHLYPHQDEIDEHLKTRLQNQDLNNGTETMESSMVASPEMNKKLLKTCRCGRPRKRDDKDYCLQKAVNPFLPQTKNTEEAEKLSMPFRVPSTSNCMFSFVPSSSPTYHCMNGNHNTHLHFIPNLKASFGWLQDKPSYHKLEQSMKYISPTFSMPGPRVSDAPYHNIFIG